MICSVIQPVVALVIRCISVEFQMSKPEIRYRENLDISVVLMKCHFDVGHMEFIV